MTDKEMQDLIPFYVQKWIDITTRPADKDKAKIYIDKVYKMMDYPPPKIIWSDNPELCIKAALDANKGDKEKVQHAWYLSIWWLAWCGRYDFARATGTKFDEEKFDLFTNFMSEVTFLIPYDTHCFVSEKPIALHHKNQQLHNPNGMAIEYLHHWGEYVLNGVVVPEWLVMQRDTEIDPVRMRELSNAEQRKEFVRKVGLERIEYKLGAKTIDERTVILSTPITAQWPCHYKLIELDYGHGVIRRALRMPNPSVPEVWHVEYVPRTCKTVEEAIEFRLKIKERGYTIDDKKGVDYQIQGDRVFVPHGKKVIKRWPAKIA